VIEEADGTIYGDGVNIAARLEALAEGGSVCISSTVYDAVEGKLALGFDFLGEHQVKNIAKPVRVYRVRAESKPASARPRSKRRMGWQIAVPVVALILLLLGAVGAWRWSSPSVSPLSEKASIAVLPFENIGGDSKWDRFADGITEDIITDLSHSKDLIVIARNSTEVYKGKPADIRQVGRDLGVKYVLEGSIQSLGERIRVTAQLVEARQRQPHLVRALRPAGRRPVRGAERRYANNRRHSHRLRRGGRGGRALAGKTKAAK
jgi:TolB-like protein